MSDTALMEFPAGGTPIEAVSRIMALEQAMMGMRTIELPLEHWFPAGLYARKIFMPAGTTLTSKVHKSEHLSIIMQGDVTVYSEDGSTKRLQAPQIFITYPGTKRALHIHEDTVWLTVHACGARAVDDAERELVDDASTVEDYLRVTGSAPARLEDHL